MYLLFDNNNGTIVQQFLLDKYKHTKGERGGETKPFFSEGGSLRSLMNQLLVFALLRLNTRFPVPFGGGERKVDLHFEVCIFIWRTFNYQVSSISRRVLHCFTINLDSIYRVTHQVGKNLPLTFKSCILV